MFHRTSTKIIVASLVSLATLGNALATPNVERVERVAPSRKRLLEVAQATDGPQNEDLTRLVFPPLQKRRRVGNANKDLSVPRQNPTAAPRQHSLQNADILPSERPENRCAVAEYLARIGLSQPPLAALEPEPLLLPRPIERASRSPSILLTRARNPSTHASASSSPGSLSDLLQGLTLNTPPASSY